MPLLISYSGSRVTLTLVLAESAVELIPPEINRHPSVLAYAKRRGKQPEKMLLDRTYHHSAMVELQRKMERKGTAGPLTDVGRRGRPDIVHLTLLEALGTPLNLKGQLTTYVHTLDGHVIEINPRVRLPRNYDRFLGLIEQLYEEGRAPPEGEPLLSLRKMALRDLLEKIAPSFVVALSSEGRRQSVREICSRLAAEKSPLALIGGFPRSHFTQSTKELADEIVSIWGGVLEAWIVAGRLIYEFERSIGLD